MAVHLSRLDVPARFLGAVGRDPLGERLMANLASEGVDTDFMWFDEDLPTALYLKNPTEAGTAVHYYRNGSAATRLRELPPEATNGVGHVHVTGITPAISPSCLALVESILGGDGYTTSFDVNYRPALWSVEVAAPLLRGLGSRATLTFVGLDEARQLWDVETPAQGRDLLPADELVVKNGDGPAFAFTGDREGLEVPSLQVPVLEPVGAGDAFAAGYLSSRRRGDDPATSLRYGHAVAAGVLRARGDQGDHPDPRLIEMAQSGHRWPRADDVRR